MSAIFAAPAYQAAASRCAHCGLPLSARAHRESHAGATLLFCCVGCVLVYRLIGTSGEGGRADWFLAKLGLAALLAGNVMMFQSLAYFGALDSLGADVVRTSSWIMLCCSLAVFALLGVPMLRIAVSGLKSGRLSLEVLIGFGALAAIGFSAAQTLRGGRDVYYDSGTMVLVFVTLGQYLDAESRRRALAVLEPTMNRASRLARVMRGATEITLDPVAVRRGEWVLVRAGEEIPVDGTVHEGSADVHEPLLTGEWRPRHVTVGDAVSAGSTAMDGALTVTASGVAETLAARVTRFALEARDRRAPIEAVVDRVTALFIPAVMLVALASVGLWAAAGYWQRGFEAALAVLVVACPCALGIATPIATTIALARAIGRGSLVRSGAVLEALSKITVVAFDKTGTLTAGRPTVGEFHSAVSASVDASRALYLAAAVEAQVTHPYARALVDAQLATGSALRVAGAVRVTAGAGAEGVVDGTSVMVGKRSWMVARGISVPAALDPDGTSVGLVVDGRFVGEWSLEDALRREAPAVIAQLRCMKLPCHILSGDRDATVARVASCLSNVAYAGDLSPTDKPERVRALRTGANRVAMIGDGVNDAPALGAADVGIAFGASADAARQTADVTILRDDLCEVPALLKLSRKTMRIVRQNLVWAFAYNSIAVLIAAGGWLRPVLAAAAMVLSSVCVVANSMRLRESRPGTMS